MGGTNVGGLNIPNLAPSMPAALAAAVAKGYQDYSKKKKEEEDKENAAKAKLSEMLLQSQINVKEFGQKETIRQKSALEILGVTGGQQLERLDRQQIHAKDMQLNTQVYGTRERIGTEAFTRGTQFLAQENLKEIEAIRNQYKGEEGDRQLYRNMWQARDQAKLNLERDRANWVDRFKQQGESDEAALVRANNAIASSEKISEARLEFDERTAKLRWDTGSDTLDFTEAEVALKDIYKIRLTEYNNMLAVFSQEDDKGKKAIGDSIIALGDATQKLHEDLIKPMFQKRGQDVSNWNLPTIEKIVEKRILWDKTTFDIIPGEPTLVLPERTIETPGAEITAGEQISEVGITAAMQMLDANDIDINAEGVTEILKTRISGLTDGDITEIKRRRKTK